MLSKPQIATLKLMRFGKWYQENGVRFPKNRMLKLKGVRLIETRFRNGFIEYRKKGTREENPINGFLKVALW